jgi:hypothetical protein
MLTVAIIIPINANALHESNGIVNTPTTSNSSPLSPVDQ